MRIVGIDFFCMECSYKFVKEFSEEDLSKKREFRENQYGMKYFCYSQECPKCNKKIDSKWNNIISEAPYISVRTGKFEHIKKLEREITQHPMKGDHVYHRTIEKGYGLYP